MRIIYLHLLFFYVISNDRHIDCRFNLVVDLCFAVVIQNEEEVLDFLQAHDVHLKRPAVQQHLAEINGSSADDPPCVRCVNDVKFFEWFSL